MMATDSSGAGNTKSGWMFLAWWLLWTVAVAIPTAAVVVFLPGIRTAAVTAAFTLFVGFPAFAIGRAWNSEECAGETHEQAKGFLLLLIVLPVLIAGEDMYRREAPFAASLVFTVAALIGVCGGFFLGRLIAKKHVRPTSA